MTQLYGEMFRKNGFLKSFMLELRNSYFSVTIFHAAENLNYNVLACVLTNLHFQ